MSLVYDRNNENSSSMRRSGFIHGMQCISVYDSPEEKRDDRLRLLSTEEEEVERDDDESGSCSSSSIGRNSDDSGESPSDDDDSPEPEVQSQLKGPLDTMDALQEILPLRKGISKFYNGKSKSFTSLADAAAVFSVKDFAKPEDPYNRKRKNLLARSSSLDKKPNNLLGNIGTKISMASSPSNCLPPLHPQCKKSTTIIKPSSSSFTARPNPPCRSYSLSDLQFVAATTPNMAGLAVHSGNKGNQLR
ncbi:hypothetical protein Goklo_010068 [Gossypium klotzschianum]|uniref:Uncharacterized protein n=1 Tax=Gossypium klotzschianum TaxID=34286 RepID=A0A7J8V4V0_9ROSI|nr:hypothetical protein [Gossypium klotzschianum]